MRFAIGTESWLLISVFCWQKRIFASDLGCRPMHRQAQFEHLRASELYCPTCRKLRPVRERLLLVLPRAELYDYRCVTCGLSLGSREVKAPAQALVPASTLPARRLVRQNSSAE